MTSSATYRVATAAEVPSVSEFVRAVYAAQIAPAGTAAGQGTFAAYTDPDAMIARAATHVLWLAERAGAFVGVLEVREGTHVALLFVAPNDQRQGIGRALLEAAFGPCERWPTLTVNSTPGAVGAYARLGFHATGPVEESSGLRYQPMRRPGATAPTPPGTLAS